MYNTEAFVKGQWKVLDTHTTKEKAMSYLKWKQGCHLSVKFRITTNKEKTNG